MKKRILSFCTFTEAAQLEQFQLENDVEIAECYPSSIDEEPEALFVTYWKWVEVKIED